MNKHIQGPWTAHEPDEELDKYHWTIRAPGTRKGMVSFEVARISGKNNDTDANTARLIAAAPDLLEALQELLTSDRANSFEIVGRDTDGHPLNVVGVARKKARTAIAKATGEKE